ncbi:uncharacterized protein LOC130668793 isoform X2 [Microplitis mediator]|uniref:uncharacterized protein LOC130668793 isoform X2 n=1 Tax=Microplitis mediator TaxID=375433 RepID=UPI00255449FE|nr:uncharacterized protein LOC130668793 isoform X2 [Microplitis mediator]
MKKFFLFLLSTTCFTVILSSVIRQDMAIVRICNTTDPVDLRVLNDYLMNHNLNRLHIKSHHPLACFLLCVYSEFNWMDRHGGFKVHNIKAWMLRAELSENDTDILLRKCISLDPCTRAQHFTECFWTNHQDVTVDHRHSLHSIMHKDVH